MKYYEVIFTIEAPKTLMQDACDTVAALAGEAGFETFEETESGLKGYIQQALFDENALEEAIHFLPFPQVNISYTVNEAEDKDWNEQWEQQGFEPIVVNDRCTIHDGRHLPASTTDIMIEIDAHLAFGTGNHETTRMVAATLLSMPLTGKSVLDCGCGTGILSIVALKGGASKGTGYDIDEWSVDNARHNAVINSVDNRFTSLLGDSSVLNGMTEHFDIVVANINRNILMADMPSFTQRMADEGHLILSGFYATDIPLLKQRAETLGLRIFHQNTDNEWACLHFIRQ